MKNYLTMQGSCGILFLSTLYRKVDRNEGQAVDNAQILKGILEGCVLAIVAKGETYGYAILGALEEAGIGEIGEGTLYPILTRLEKHKLLLCRRMRSPLGPMRKYYTVTPAGEACLQDFRRRYLQITASAASILIDEAEDSHGI